MIRKATYSDARGIAEVHISSWRSTYREIVPNEYLDTLDLKKGIENWQQILMGEQNQGATFVATESDGIVGFASVGASREPGLEFQGEIYAIYLLDSFQKRGIGKELFITSMRQLNSFGYESQILWVLRDNPGINFYLHMGGQLITEKTDNIGGKDLRECAIGWNIADW